MLEHELSYASTYLHSPYYMTPELMNNFAYDFKIDIWAFGCVLFELCSLKLNFSSNNIVELASKVMKGKSEDIPSNYSKQLNVIYQKCLKKKPEDRWSSR